MSAQSTGTVNSWISLPYEITAHCNQASSTVSETESLSTVTYPAQGATHAHIATNSQLNLLTKGI